jgi:RNA polymerase sigma-70 factor (ECF subfamily)
MTGEQFIKQVEGTQMAFRRFLVALCCGDAALADDISQDAYIKAYLSCESLNDIGKFRAWIFKIGYNTFISHKRTVKAFADYEEARDIMSV